MRGGIIQYMHTVLREAHGKVAVGRVYWDRAKGESGRCCAAGREQAGLVCPSDWLGVWASKW